MSNSNINRNSKILYFSAVFVGIILLTGSIFPVMSFVQAQPPHKVIERFNQQDVPPGLTRVTIVHGVDEQRTEIDHGAGKVPPPFQKQESFQCTNGGLDTCDTNSFNGKKWFDLPVNYYVNLEGSNDDGNFLEAVKAGSQVWEDDPNSSFDQEYISETTLQASGAQKRQMDGVNVVDWGNTKKFGSNVIAVTIFWYFTSTGEIVEADFRFNDGFSWASNGGPTVQIDPATNFGDPASMDVQNIAAHEFGHFHAALLDITDGSANKLTMYAFGAEGETQKRDLGVGDQISIATAYPPSSPPPIVNDPPTVEITGPADDSIFNVEDSISFTGTASDFEGVDITSALSWSSNRDGIIGSGGSFSKTLSLGTHTITASATDSGGETGSSSITVTVQGSGSTVSVDSITYFTEGGKNQDKHLNIAIHVSDDVAGATVSIDLDNTTTGQSWIGTGTTDGSGNILFTLKNSPDGCYTTTVTSVSASGFTEDTSTPANGICKPT